MTAARVVADLACAGGHNNLRLFLLGHDDSPVVSECLLLGYYLVMGLLLALLRLLLGLSSGRNLLRFLDCLLQKTSAVMLRFHIRSFF